MLRSFFSQRYAGWATCAYALATALALGSAHGEDITALWNSSSGNWTDAASWSTNPLFPNNSAPNLYDGTIPAGSVTLNQNIAINHLTLSGGTLGGASALALAEGIAWSGGSLELTGAGRVTLGAGSASNVSGTPIFISGRIVGSGGATLSIPEGATLTALNDASFFADATSPLWMLGNAGTFISRGTNGTRFTSMDAAFNNTGTVRVELAGGTSQTLSLAGGGTLGGSIELEAGAIIELGGTTTLLPGVSLNGDGVAVIAGTVVAAGSISSRNIAVAVGELNVGSSLFQVSGSATQSGGIVSLGGGTLRLADSTGTLLMDGGRLTGIGTLDAKLQTQGDIAPGTSLGTLNVTGATNFGEDARLVIEIGGTGAGLFDVLAISSTTDLGGLLAVSFVNGFTPNSTDTFTILNAASGVNGFFVNAALDGARFNTADGLGSFAIDYTPNSVTLTAFVPEPATTTLLGICGTLFVGIRRRGGCKAGR